jgi:hypothetical protein
VGLVFRAGVGHADELPLDRQPPILVKVLAYDGNLKTRAGNEIALGVVVKNGNAPSDKAAETLLQAFKVMGPIKAQGLPIRVFKVTYESASSLITTIKSEGADALYVCPGLDNELPVILEVSRLNKVMSIAGVESYFNKGAAFGVFVVDNKPALHINLATSRSEGVAFGSDLLRLAKVVK